MVGIYSVPSKTGRHLAEMLDVSFFSHYNPYKTYPDTIIRWGTYKNGPPATYINSQEAIALTTDKKKTREFLHEQGIPVPEMGYEKFPCVGRPRKHRGGRKFHYCIDQIDVRRAIRRGAEYFAHYYPKQNEYRVHIGGGKLLGIAKKIDGNPLAYNWNFKSGYKFKYLHSFEWDIEVIRLAKRAIKAVGLDFAGIDIMSDPKDPTLPHAVVCEINSAPSLYNYSLNKYVEYFKKVIEEKQEEVYNEGSLPNPFDRDYDNDPPWWY